MRKLLILALAAAPAVALAAPMTDAEVAGLRDAALKDDVAWDIVEGLTTEIGPRMPGSEAEARARDWSVKKLKALGFRNVRIETCAMPVWVRGEERASVIAPFPATLALAALGNSGSTPAEGIEGEIAYFPTIADFEAAPDAAVRGRIVFVSHAMKATQDGSSYGAFGRARFVGPGLAARKGAAAFLVRSIGTDSNRLPHTGATGFGDSTPIPAAALSIPDSENLERIIARGKPVKLRLLLTSRRVQGESGNVIAEVPGSDPRSGIITIGGHLDSWDLGTGAIDDASGVAITAAAAKRIMDAGRPRRTIRVVWFGAEEVGGCGGPDYYARRKDERHALTAESDFGADRVWRFQTKLGPAAKPVADRLARALAPLGIAHGKGEADGGADIGPLVRAGTPVIDLNQDGTRYFDLHHTANDTLDKVDPEQLRQNVAAWTAMLAITANAVEDMTFSTP